MKKIFKTGISMLIVLLIAMCSVPSFFAAGATVNGNEVKIGDIITYTLLLSDSPEPIQAVDMALYYDSKKLEIVNKSFSYKGLAGGVSQSNLNIPGEILFVAANVQEGFDFSEQNEFISIQFKVKGAGDSDITYLIEEMYTLYEDDSNDYLKRYNLTYELKINGETVIENEPPIVDKNESRLNSKKGTFVHQESGKGEDNDKPLESRAAQNTQAQNNNQVGTRIVYDSEGNIIDIITETDANSENIATDANGNTVVSNETNNSQNSSGTTPIIIAVFILALIVAIFVVILVARKKEASNADDENE